MLTKPYNSIPLIHFENLIQYKSVFHFVTTRIGGLSSGKFASFNLGYSPGDNKSIVTKNRQLLTEAIGINQEKILTIKQSHSDKIRIIDSESKPESTYSPLSDAQITSEPGICLVVAVADCVPILLYDPECQVIAVIHAGWRGTVKKITLKTIKLMHKSFGCSPEKIIAGIGPSIGPCCYEVGQDVINKIDGKLGHRESLLIEGEKLNKARFDLWEANRHQLIEAGVRLDNIESSGICTSCNNETFYSFRKEPLGTGRMMAGIMLLNSS